MVDLAHYFEKVDFSGRIEVIFGPMFSGKTTELIRRIRRYQIANKTCLLLKYKGDIRYDEEKECVVTHDRGTWKAIPTLVLGDMLMECMCADVVGIDEGQFFPDLLEVCEHLANRGKIVIVAALDGTFQRRAFETTFHLMSVAEEVVKLSAVCRQCHQHAPFSKRIGDDMRVELIGGADKYAALCRRCFHASHAINTPLT